MKCPKCGGELKVYKTSVDRDFIDVDIHCVEDEEHRFWVRLYEEDLEEE